jgi:hypothetical protein
MILQSILGGLYDYAKQDRPMPDYMSGVPDYTAQDPLMTQMRQPSQALGVMGLSPHAPQMNMTPTGNMSPVNMAGPVQQRGLLDMIGDRFAENYANRYERKNRMPYAGLQPMTPGQLTPYI